LHTTLKLKEIFYIHAEGYAGGEMKYGPIAWADRHSHTFGLRMPVEAAIKSMATMLWPSRDASDAS
jgi:glucosamine--fructose-6-phosphate aminotransferase (isomerizing)